MKKSTLRIQMKWTVLGLAFLALACSETPEPTPPPTPNPPVSEEPGDSDETGTIELKEIEGKWMIGDITLQENLRIKKLSSTKINFKKSGNSIQFGGKNLRINQENNPAFLELFENGTYLLSDGKDAFYRGWIRELESGIWELEGFGTMEKIQTQENELHFELVQKNAGNPSVITATKAPSRETNQPTTLLCRDWYLESYISTAGDLGFQLGEEIEIYQNNKPVDSGILQYFNVVFTPSGTLFTYLVVNDLVYIDFITDWNWNSDFSAISGILDDEEFTDVKELSESRLAFSSQYTDEEGNAHQEEMSFKSGEIFIEDREYLDEEGLVKLPFQYNFLNSKPYDFDFEESSFILKGVKFTIADGHTNTLSCDLEGENIEIERPGQYGLGLLDYLIIDLANFPTLEKVTLKINENCGTQMAVCTGDNGINSEMVEVKTEGTFNNIVTYSMSLKGLDAKKLYLFSCEGLILNILIE